MGGCSRVASLSTRRIPGALHEEQENRRAGISSYELFIGALSVLSILNLVLLVLPISSQVKQLILIVDVALTAIS
jgi:hypothetical protein